jgi:hypothetical protein
MTILRLIDKIFLGSVAGVVVVGPKVHIVIRPLGVLVDLLATCGSGRSAGFGDALYVVLAGTRMDLGSLALFHSC